MKWVSPFLVLYVLVVAGLFAALAWWGSLAAIGPIGTTVAGLIALGLGVMIAVGKTRRMSEAEEFAYQVDPAVASPTEGAQPGESAQPGDVRTRSALGQPLKPYKRTPARS